MTKGIILPGRILAVEFEAGFDNAAGRVQLEEFHPSLERYFLPRSLFGADEGDFIVPSANLVLLVRHDGDSVRDIEIQLELM